MNKFAFNSPMFLLSSAAVINKILGLARTLLLLFLIGESIEYSELLSYIYIVQLFLIPFDYSFLNTVFTGLMFERATIRKLSYLAIISLFLLSSLVFLKGDYKYAFMSIIYYVLSLLGSFGIVVLNRVRYFKYYLFSSISSSMVLLISVFFVDVSIFVLFFGRIFSVLPLIMGLILVRRKISLSHEEIKWRKFINRLMSSLSMNKSTIAMILLPLLLASLDYNLTYYAYAMSLSGIINTVIVRNSQLLTMSGISYSINLDYILATNIFFGFLLFFVPIQKYMWGSFDLVLFTRYVFINATILLLLGRSDINRAKNVAR